MAQGKSVIVVKSGEKDQEKRFLGYEFSARRGSEGIKLNESSLLDEDNLLSSKKANSYILRNINDEEVESIDESLKDHVSLRQMQDLFDWDSDIFSNKIFLGEGRLTSKVKLKFLCDVLETVESGSRPVGGISAIHEGLLNLGGKHIGENGLLNLTKKEYTSSDFYHGMKSGHIKSGDILICKDGQKRGNVRMCINFQRNLLLSMNMFLYYGPIIVYYKSSFSCLCEVRFRETGKGPCL